MKESLVSTLSYLLGIAALIYWHRCTDAQTTRPAVDLALSDLVAHLAVPVMVEDGAYRAGNRRFLPVHTQLSNLCIKVREVTALEKGIVGEADTWNDVRSTNRDLLSLREKTRC